MIPPGDAGALSAELVSHGGCRSRPARLTSFRERVPCGNKRCADGVLHARSIGSTGSRKDRIVDAVKVYVNGEIVPAEDAHISVWDGGFQSGDAVYEGMRVYNRCVYRLYEHLRRLYDCAHAIGIQ